MASDERISPGWPGSRHKSRRPQRPRAPAAPTVPLRCPTSGAYTVPHPDRVKSAGSVATACFFDVFARSTQALTDVAPEPRTEQCHAPVRQPYVAAGFRDYAV